MFTRLIRHMSYMKKLIVAIINLLVVTNSFVITELRQQSLHCFTSTSNESQRTERVRRALSFYSAALPLFIFYKALDFKIQLRKFSTVEGSLGDKNISVENIRLDEAAYDKLHEWGSKLITEKVVQLKGFYVKTGQIISTRVDIFPKQYTTKLAITQDRLDPVPTELIKDIVRQDLLNGADLCELFASFDEAPLGSASIAQVHRATLLDGRVVAVKVQRPGIRSKLLGDIKNLQTFAKLVSRSLLIDYYKIFLELEKTLVLELDFLHEAQATAKVAAAVAHAPNNKPQKPPVRVPLPIPGLVSTRVMVMEYIEGVPLSRLSAEMESRGVAAGSPEARFLGKKLLAALTDAYAAMVFGSGIIHGDPHPGNIFVMEGGDVVLLDCGQVKQFSTKQRLQFASLLVLVHRWEQLSKSVARDVDDAQTTTQREKQLQLCELTTQLAKTVKDFGVSFKQGAGDECAAAVALLLFGSSDTILPGGYAGEEVSANSPIVQVAEFPSEFILLGRATVMIRGIANRLGIPWGLAERWAAAAQVALDATGPGELLPIWSIVRPTVATTADPASAAAQLRTGGANSPVLSDIWRALAVFSRTLQLYVGHKFVSLFNKFAPQFLKKWALRLVLKVQNV